MYDSEYDEVKAILDNNEVTDLDQIEYGSEVYEDLYNSVSYTHLTLPTILRV